MTSASYLTNGAAAEFIQDGDVFTITLPVEPLDEYDSVIKVIIGNPDGLGTESQTVAAQILKNR